jgi:2-polyprenyl-3-methyl-5-hydroxy-6-metoxy-1,4-benzoquinol methylase
MKPQPGSQVRIRRGGLGGSSPQVSTVDTVRDFWQAHINNEYYTEAERASDSYFDEIEQRRYATHYHLPELFASMDGAGNGAASGGRSPQTPPKKILEIGCGIGVDSIQLAKRGYAVTAVDLTENALTVARQFAAHRGVNIDFRLGNAEGLDFPDQSFDAVYSFGVLHHTPDIERSVAEVHRVLRPGGTAYVMLYHRDSLVNLVHRALRLPYESPTDRKDHCPVVYTFSRGGVRRLFRGFSAVEVHADYPFTYGFGPLTTKTPLALRRPLGRAIGWHLMITAKR